LVFDDVAGRGGYLSTGIVHRNFAKSGLTYTKSWLFTELEESVALLKYTSVKRSSQCKSGKVFKEFCRTRPENASCAADAQVLCQTAFQYSL